MISMPHYNGCFPTMQESKFLGGDMEHTHLVKGLDFALLQKVRSEIHNIEREDDEEKKERQHLIFTSFGSIQK